MTVINETIWDDPSSYLAAIDHIGSFIYGGDSGSPLLNAKNEQIGIVSWGAIQIKDDSNFVFGFSRFSFLTPWIDEAMKNMTEHLSLLRK